MPPKFKFTKQEIINAALGIVRSGGMSALTARSLAASLNCSVKPIFGTFQNMEEVQSEVISAAMKLYHSYLEDDIAAGNYPPYKATGMAYIRFAKEEKELFKLLFMRDRTFEAAVAADNDELQPILNIVQNQTGFSKEDATLFHVEMWVFVHGIATMMATSYLEWDTDFISRMISDAYSGISSRVFNKEKTE